MSIKRDVIRILDQLVRKLDPQADFWEDECPDWSLSSDIVPEGYDATISLADSLSSEGVPVNNQTHPGGYNVSLSICESGGRIVTSFAPYNYTDQVWSKDIHELENRACTVVRVAAATLQRLDDGPDDTLADRAEAWWRERGNEVPARQSQDWRNMYERWIEYAFDDHNH
jgi:hypothetical protein